MLQSNTAGTQGEPRQSGPRQRSPARSFACSWAAARGSTHAAGAAAQRQRPIAAAMRAANHPGHPQHQARKHNSPFHFPMSRGVSPMVYLRGRGALNQVIQGFFYGAEWNRVMIIAIRMLIEHMNGITCRPLLPEAARRFETAPAAYQPLSWQTRRMLCHRTAGCRAGERSTPSGDTATPRINS